MSSDLDTQPKPPTSIAFAEPILEKPMTESSTLTATSSHGSTSRGGRRASAGAAIIHDGDDGFEQDWSRTTAEHETWAMRERRRSSMWSKVDGYPGGSWLGASRTRTVSGGSRGTSGSALTASTSNGSAAAGAAGGEPSSRRGTILSLFHEQDDHEVAATPRRSGKDAAGKVRRERKGSILSLFRRGKDEKGRSILDSGGEGKSARPVEIK